MPTPADASDARAIASEVVKEMEAEQEAAPAEVVAPEVKPEVQPEPEKEKALEPKVERPERKSTYVPVQKANQWRHEAQESKAKVADLEAQLAATRSASEQKVAVDDVSPIAKRIAEAHGASEDAVREIIIEARKGMKIEPSEDMKAVLNLKATLEKQAEEAAFQQDLSAVLAKHPELKGYEQSLRETAYAEGNERIPLDLLAYRVKEDLNLHSSPPSAEGRGSQAQSAPEIDFNNLTEAQLNDLSDADMDKFIAFQREGLRKRTGVRLR
jgi:hypothetical protein